MTFEQLITFRQSDRKYDVNRPVEDDQLMKCLEAARLAPSACNAQPWKFVVVRDPQLLASVGDCAASMGMNKFCLQVPVIIALVLEKPNFTSKIGSVLKDKDYTLIDIGVVANQFCLQAAELGLGTCMIGWFNEKKVQQLLAIPSKKRIPLLISVGYPASETRPKIRKKMDAIASFEKY